MLLYFYRTGRYCQWQPQVDSWSNMAPDFTIPDWQEQVPNKETDVGMVTGCYP